MEQSGERWAVRVMSGEARGLGATLLRAGTSLIEPFYAGVMRARSFAYDRGIKQIHRLPRPAVSIGNITTGGTGKTPVVRWLAERLMELGLHPAILMRGYKQEATGGSDEARLLTSSLGDRAIIVAKPDRVAGAVVAMAHLPPADVFLLDDGFQHRRAARDFELVLVDATRPFGFGHVLPRGLLREPLAGLARADAILITRATQVSSQDLAKIESEIRRHAPKVNIYHASHAHAALKFAEGERAIEELSRRRFFLFSGIGNPSSLRQQLDRFAARLAGWRAFEDHHAYTEAELESLDRDASAAGAQMLVTTEKDWVKIAPLKHAGKLPIVRLDLRIQFEADHEERLLSAIVEKLKLTAGSSRPA